MEAIRLNKTMIGLLAILLVGLYLSTVTVEPVFAGNWSPKHMDKGIKIDKPDKDKKDKDPIKIKSHPILKSPQPTAITTLSWGAYSQK